MPGSFIKLHNKRGFCKWQKGNPNAKRIWNSWIFNDEFPTLCKPRRINGTGIIDKAKSLIFEPFYRVDESRNKEYGGLGLGMPFAKVVADLYKGDIQIEDNIPNGTKFTIIFPDIVE